MFKFYSLLGGVVLSMGVAATSAVCNNYWGGMSCGQGTVPEVFSQGIVSLVGTEVLGKSKVQGSFSASQVKLNILQVFGMANITDSKINGDADFFGGLNARNTDFYKKVTIHSENVTFDSCNVPKIVISSDKRVGSIVKLMGSTKIGQIVFDQADGQVWLFDDAKVDQPVVGAKVFQK